MNYPKVSIIILTWNNYKDTKICLESLLKKENYPHKEIVVIDNDSNDNSFQKLQEEFSQCVFMRNNKNLGFAAGNNPGIKYALKNGSDYIFILNNDTVFTEPVLSKLIKISEQNKTIGIAAPKLLNNDQSVQQSIVPIKTPANFLLWLFRLTRNPDLNKISGNLIFNNYYISGAAMLIKKGVIRKLGVFDERFFFYSEDMDFSYRAVKSGFNLAYIPDLKIIHKHGQSSTREKALVQLYRANFQFLYKYWNSVLINSIKPAVSVTVFIRFLKNGAEFLLTRKETKRIYAKSLWKICFKVWVFKN
ncbi:MAG: glycosyltransferase family 2 protein [Candidatus Krumholzibacteriota bacterium]|nr:glycosyltransferase family 2 protein [Candidatus Krumholzibacteriota bacterium]